MHVLQWVAVEAVSKDGAEYRVQSMLDNGFFDWSDWAEIGGRWSDEEHGNVISIKDEPARASEVIEKAMENRRNEVKDLLKDIDVDGVISWVEDVVATGQESYNHEAMELKMALGTALGDNNYDSYFYDAGALSTSPQFVLDGTSASNYLVAVDFHY
jgi:hypothetical protein